MFKTLKNRLNGRISDSSVFVALRDINVEIRKGEKIGLIGDNGAGKSTLLKLVAKLYLPTTGELCVNGSVSLLSGLGIGMVDELSVQQNAFLYGAIYGLDRDLMKENLDEMLAWADLQNFKDAAFKTLSSGMKARLAFSISRHFSSDVNLFDEALSAGDQRFKDKCENVFESYKNGDKTFVFATHSMPFVKKICSKALWLHKGAQMAFGDAEKVLQQYEEFHGNSAVTQTASLQTNPNVDEPQPKRNLQRIEKPN
jgi:ABC-type polysaccharide/polyol phosphate transport system ATPase subunit